MSVQLANYPGSGSYQQLYGTSNGNIDNVGVTFECTGSYVIDSVQCYLNKTGSPTGNVNAILYALTGTPGTNAVPTGSALATSASLSVSTLTSTSTLYTLSFTGANRYVMSNSTYYAIVLDYGGGDSSDNISVEIGGTVSGQNQVYYLVGTGWEHASTQSAAFVIYGAYDTTPAAAFVGVPTTLNAGDNVQFTDQSTYQPTSWSWTFGDGGTSTSQNPLYEYATAGTYTVALTATNDGGSNTDTQTNYITVEATRKMQGMSTIKGISTVQF